MLFTTTSNIEGHKITQYIGLVSGHAIVGINAVRDMFAGVRDIAGGRVSGYEKELEKARDGAADDMAKSAERMGANAVIGIDLDFEVMGKENGMIMCVASGTAVKYN